MPNRFIKESIRTSDTLAEISAEAERLFWRLIVTADDFGRFDARPNIVLGQCLSSFIGQFTSSQVSVWLRELEQASLIQMYTVENRDYLVLTKWNKHQQTRAKTSKFPEPPTLDSKCMQAQANVPVFVFDNVFENVSGSGREKTKTLPPLDEESNLSLDTYCQEIENQMVACGANPNYSAKGEAYKYMLQFHKTNVPIQFIRTTIVQAYAKNPDISTFTYCAKIIKDSWARELQKQQPIDAIEFTTSKPRAAPALDEDFLTKFAIDEGVT